MHERILSWSSQLLPFQEKGALALLQHDALLLADDMGLGKTVQAIAAMRVWDVIILDEAQKIKNRNAVVSKVCKKLLRHRAWALTGTPLENCEDDLASVLEFVRKNTDGAPLPSMRPGFTLRIAQEDHQLRRRKQDVLKDLPPMMLVRVPLELTPLQWTIYEAMQERGRAHLSGLGQSAGVMHVLELITRLKQICNFCPETGSSAKADDLVQRLGVLRGRGNRALVFSQWTSDIHGTGRLAERLHQFQPLVYTGTLGQMERAARIDAFRQDSRNGALILSLRAGGQGLNLQEASYVFHFDRWWNPAVENQATGRSHRMGQMYPVTVYAYTCVNTIEERIEKILGEKRALFAALVDQVTIDVRKLLTAEELFGLFGLSAPGRLKARASSADRTGHVKRIISALRKCGWSKINADSDSGITARRYDEIGVERTVRIRFRERWSDSLIDDSVGKWDLIVCPSGFPDEARALAEAHSIGLLDEDDLRRLEEAAGTVK